MGKATSAFLEHLLKAQPMVRLQDLTPEEKKEMAEAHWNHLFDLNGPRSITRTPNPTELWYHQRLFTPFANIHKSLEALQDITVYFRRFPYRGTRVSPVGHLRRNIGLFLEEVYILRQRLIDFLNILEKDYVGSVQGRQLAAVNPILCRMSKNHLRAIIEARREHVHGSGYEEEGIKRLDTLELLVNHLPAPKGKKDRIRNFVFKDLYVSGCKKERKRWTKLVENWNMILEKLVDGYCEVIDPIIFSSKGEIIFPPAVINYSST